MINVLPGLLRDALNALSFEKWAKLRLIADMEPRSRLGESMIEVAGRKFTVIIDKGTIRLRHAARNETEVEVVMEALRVMYGNDFINQVRMCKSGRYRVVVVPARLN